MASDYSPLKIQLMATGENLGTWGNVTNANLGTAIEEAIVGSADVTFASNNQSLTLADTNSTQVARHLRLNLIGATGGSTRTLTVPDIEKIYIINNTCADAVQVKNSTGSNIAVPAGKTMWVYSTGANVVDAVTHLTSLTLAAPLAASSGGTGATTLNGLAFTGENITNLNASNIASGTLANARTTASDANGASTIVQRDASGNFSANTITASLSGNVTGNLTGTASNATVLQNARTISISGGSTGTATSFDGSANISIPITGINASVIDTGTIANARTTASSSNIANTIVQRDAAGSFTANNVNATLLIGGGASVTNLNASNITSGTIANTRTTASSSNGASTIVARDSSGNFSANTITANVVGNLSGNVTGNLTGIADSALVLQNARTISISGGVFGSATSFNGSANITIPVTAINASVIDTGTIANGRTTATSSNVINTIVQRDSFGSFSANTITANAISATTITGSGSSITSLNASNIASGTLSSSYGGTSNNFFSVSGPASTTKTYTFPNENMSVGYRNVPLSSDKTSAYTLQTSDVGKAISVGSGGSIVIPNSIFSAGDAVSLYNNTAGNVTISCSISVAYISGINTSKASVTLSTRGVATILFISGSACVISGSVS